jgi:hypothetical protein
MRDIIASPVRTTGQHSLDHSASLDLAPVLDYT